MFNLILVFKKELFISENISWNNLLLLYILHIDFFTYHVTFLSISTYTHPYAAWKSKFLSIYFLLSNWNIYKRIYSNLTNRRNILLFCTRTQKSVKLSACLIQEIHKYLWHLKQCNPNIKQENIDCKFKVEMLFKTFYFLLLEQVNQQILCVFLLTLD